MSRDQRKCYFDGVKEHSRIKHRAVARYLRPWAEAVGSQRGVRRVWVVDGFAGAGTYTSGEDGSPLIALREARRLREAGRNYKMSCLFFEKDRSTFRRLERAVAEFRDVEVITVPHDFWLRKDIVLEYVGVDPTFMFVDPFGLGDLDFESMTNLCSKLRQVDLMTNLATPAAKRLQSGHPDLISRAVGGPGWTIDTLSEVFRARLIERGNFLNAVSLPVSAPLRGLRYEVVLAARHPKAFELWNDEIATDDRELLDRGQRELIEERQHEVSARLRELAHGRSRFTRDDLIREASTLDCGFAHRRLLRLAIEGLIATGEWQRSAGPVGTSPISPR